MQGGFVLESMSRGMRRTGWGVLAALCAIPAFNTFAADAPATPQAPQYEVDPSWPQLPLPNNWALGQIAGMTVDAQDNIWIIQRPRTLDRWERAAAESPPAANCCVPAPAVIQFDPSGKVLRAWGGPGQGYDWPASEHGIHVDYKGNVWIGGNRAGRPGGPPGREGPFDGMVLKFTQDGKFLMQIGGAGMSKGSRDHTQLSGAADIHVHPPTNEVFIADGYGNNRVIVFDADTGEFKRLWGAYGKPPTDERLPPYDPNAKPAQQFRLVHCLRVADDGMVYVCDRDNNRIQVFRNDGTFVTEWFYLKETLTDKIPGTVGHLSLWPDAGQSMLIAADIGNSQVRFIRRSDGQVLGHFGHYGHYAGQLSRIHQLTVDSKGNVYTGEAGGAKRVQKFVITSGQAPRR